MKQISILITVAVCFVACQIDGEYASDLVGRVTPVKVELKYIADPDARFVAEYANMELDTLPYYFSLGFVYTSRAVYLKENSLSNLLRVYRLKNGERTLDLEEQVEVSPVIVAGDVGGAYSMINLVQLTADGHVQVLNTPEAPADSSAIAVQFFYGDLRQPEAVKITVLAVDQYSLITAKPKAYVIENVPAEMKAEVGEITLRRGELSNPVVLNLNRFGEAAKGLAAKFYYRVYDSAGNLLQDYKVASSTANSVEIVPESAKRNGIYCPVYQSSVMQWEFKTEDTPFPSPKTLMSGDRW